MLRRLRALVHAQEAPRFTVIYREGLPGSRLCVVARGLVRLTTAAGVAGGDAPVEIGAGGSFGEAALVAALPRPATAVTLEPTLLLSIGHEELWGLNAHRHTVRMSARDGQHTDGGHGRTTLDAQLCRALEVGSAARMALVDNLMLILLREVGVLKALEEPTLREVAALVWLEGLDDGTRVFSEGDVATCFYVLIHGSVRVLVRTAEARRLVPVAIISADDSVPFFGDLGILRKGTRNATVVCEGRCLMLCVPARHVARFLALVPGIGRTLEERGRAQQHSTHFAKHFTLHDDLQLYAEHLRSLGGGGGKPPHAALAEPALDRSLGDVRARGSAAAAAC